MKIVFMGTPAFSIAPLERLFRDGHDIAGVFTQPDRPRSRGMKVSFSPVKETAIKYEIPVYQPASLRDESIAAIIRQLNCEIVVVVAYGNLLPREILDIPPSGCVNIHASLLPAYRGAAPIHWAILNGETETGVTSMYMAEELDAGDIISKKALQIHDDETTGELRDRLSIVGAELLSETVFAISSGKAVRIPQNHDEATFAPPIKKESSLINWADTALNIKRKVRGFNPWPIATADFGGTIYKVFSVDIGDRKPVGSNPGKIVSAGRDGLEIACSDATVIIKELQAPGGRRMAASEYLRGNLIQ